MHRLVKPGTGIASGLTPRIRISSARQVSIGQTHSYAKAENQYDRSYVGANTAAWRGSGAGGTWQGGSVVALRRGRVVPVVGTF